MLGEMLVVEGKREYFVVLRREMQLFRCGWKLL